MNINEFVISYVAVSLFTLVLLAFLTDKKDAEEVSVPVPFFLMAFWPLTLLVSAAYVVWLTIARTKK